MVHIAIKGTQIVITPSLDLYIHQRLQSLDKFIKPLLEKEDVMLKVEIARTTHHHKKGEKVYYVEFTVAIYGKTIRIEQYGDDVRGAIDIARDRLKRELRRRVEKLRTSTLPRSIRDKKVVE